MVFEPDKEFMAILHPRTGIGEDFKLLGCLFDVELRMESAIDKIAGKIRPKLKSLLRTRAFYMRDDLIIQYKAHILSLLEVHTGAIFHAFDSLLQRLDKIQDEFLMHMGIDEK